jgi:hypothetical protein
MILELLVDYLTSAKQDLPVCFPQTAHAQQSRTVIMFPIKILTNWALLKLVRFHKTIWPGLL